MTPHQRRVAEDDRYMHLVECVQLSQRYTEWRAAELEGAIGLVQNEVKSVRSALAHLHNEHSTLMHTVEGALAAQLSQILLLQDAVAQLTAAHAAPSATVTSFGVADAFAPAAPATPGSTVADMPTTSHIITRESYLKVPFTVSSESKADATLVRSTPP